MCLLLPIIVAASPPSTRAAFPSSAGMRVFKKYGNRRLYDLSTSKYVTLAEVEALVQQGAEIQVLDAKSQGDLTKEILVQIILERDSAKDLLPTSFLRQVVRMQGSPLKESFTRLLQDSLDGFVRAQHSVFDAQRNLMQGAMQAQSPSNPFAAWSPFRGPQPQASSNEGDMAQLRQEMNHTQQLLQQLLQNQQPVPSKRKPAAKKRRSA